MASKPTTLTTKRAGKCGQGECLEKANNEEAKMHELDYAGRINGWTDRLKRSADAKFKLMVTEEDMFLCFVLCVWCSMMSGS